MKCAACQAENEDALKVCSACGKPLRPRRKRKGDEEAVALTPEMEAFARTAGRVFRVAVWSTVPLLGLALGPAAAVWAAALRGPEQPGRPLVRVAFWLGLLTAVTQWAGLTLLVLSRG